MKVTDKMLDAAGDYIKAASDKGERYLVHYGYSQLLEAALADVPEPGAKEPGPFALTPREQECLTHGVDCPGCGPVFRQALDRACRTLGPQAVPAPTDDVLPPGERVFVDSLINMGRSLTPGEGNSVLAILMRVAPKPKTVEKTNEELAALAKNMNESYLDRDEAVDELVRRANGAGK